MNKICTSLEQSKKLIELGVDINTADMHYSTWTILNGGEYILSPNQVETIEELQEDYGNQVIPAWSLTALMDVLPIFSTPTAFSYKVSAPSMIKTDNGYLLKYIGDFEIKTNNGDDIESPIEILANNQIDAAFEMVCWLKENNKI